MQYVAFRIKPASYKLESCTGTTSPSPPRAYRTVPIPTPCLQNCPHPTRAYRTVPITTPSPQVFPHPRTIFRKICKISPIAMGLSVYVYLSVCLSVCPSVCYFRSHRSYINENKNVRNYILNFDICHRMASFRKLYSVTLTYIFDFKCLKYVKFVCFRMLPEAKIT